MDVRQLAKLRPLGKLETVSSVCHHLSYYNNVGLSALYKISSPSAKYDLDHIIYVVLERVVNEHSILSAIPVDENTPKPYLARLHSIDLNRSITFIERSKQVDLDEAEDKELDAILQHEANTNFKQDYGVLLFYRLLVVHTHGVDNEFTASFIFHHAIGDGVARLTFHKSFLSALRTASTSETPTPSQRQYIIPTNKQDLLPPLENLHPLPLPPLPPPFHQILNLTRNISTTFVKDCKKRNLTVTAGLIPLIAPILFDSLPRDTEALTCIIPVSLQPWLPREIMKEWMGTWIDAFKVKILSTAQDSTNAWSQTNQDIWPQARGTMKQIQTYLKNTSPSDEPHAGVAIFKTIPDVSPIFQGAPGNPRDALFELSNLGVLPKNPLRASDTMNGQEAWRVGKVTFSRSVVVSGSVLTVNVVTGGDGRIKLGFTWQENVVENSLIQTLVAGIESYFGVRGV
ncbi:hypothetical protein T440DRAFT_502005 [Plenodomus tracheiphilus IPT5]|uniref:Alcohol acetyltransferase n=1 Tax=Plenodomus tracheiphilus IPT5 TaxID=1408161 RepID=A0A6A7ATP4_9PLEO|nr:hypothetical protein T440DRAFT_502005 [Plenodomus tracheiphilus IPT5]